MSRKELLTRFGIAMAIAFSLFLLAFALTDLFIVYYVTKTLEKGLSPAFYIVEQRDGQIVASIDPSPALFTSLATSSLSGYIFDKRVSKRLVKRRGVAPLIVIVISASAVIGAIAAAAVKSNFFCGVTCPSTCGVNGVLSCQGFPTQNCACRP